jgi:hypothetical protein
MRPYLYRKEITMPDEATQLYDQAMERANFPEVLPDPLDAREKVATIIEGVAFMLRRFEPAVGVGTQRELDVAEEGLLEAVVLLQQARRAIQDKEEPEPAEPPIVPPPAREDDPDAEPTVPAPDYGGNGE